MPPLPVVPRGKRPRKFEGILGQRRKPMASILPSGVDFNCPPAFWLRAGYSLDQWKAYFCRARLEERALLSAEIEPRIIALCIHYRIEGCQPLWQMDLWIRLACDRVKGFPDTVSPSQLFERFSIDPQDPRKHVRLALELAYEYVGGFKMQETRAPKKRLELYDLLGLVMAVASAHDHLLRRGCPGSETEISRVLSNPSRLRSILPPVAARSVQGLLGKLGNRGQQVSERALRDFVSVILHPWREPRQGVPAYFVHQVRAEAIPSFAQAARMLADKQANA